MKTKDEQEDNQIDSQTESAKEIISQDTDVRTKDEEINSQDYHLFPENTEKIKEILASLP